MSSQRGSVQRRGKSWTLRIYVGKRQREITLGSVHDLPSRKARETAADNVRLRLGIAGTGAQTTMERFAEFWFLEVADGRLRQSTARDYRWRFGKYIKGRKEARLPLWEYRTRDVQNLLNGIASDHPNLARSSLQRIKALLSGIFRHSVVAGFREGNPVRDVLLPRRPVAATGSAKASRPVGVYDLRTVRAVLRQPMPPELRAAVALAAFAGLRLAELQGLTWEDVSKDAITVRRTRWKTFENAPKSKASAASVPLIPELRRALDRYRKEWDRLPPKLTPKDEDGDQAIDRSLFPSPLVAYGRYHLPTAFRAVKSEWRGWHAFRRGLASTLFQMGAEDLVVQRILRHARVIVTREHYIRQFDAKVLAAMRRI